ncbi:MAG: phospho-N-acetylmuramoyl-pentapeptide-transferase [Simkaniaceae bacterium]|nr:phospho-N-acetylmuramoyl-pentapeptide-transferase [Simkaniaceae bacterium]
MGSLLKILIHPVFGYTSTRMVLAALTTLIITIFLGPFFIKKLYELKIGQAVSRLSDVPVLDERHAKKKDTPSMGGVLILSAVIVSTLLWNQFLAPQTLLLLLATVVLGVLGALDDYIKLRKRKQQGLSAKAKMGAQIVLGLIVGYSVLHLKSPLPYFFPFIKAPLFITGGVISLFLTLFVVIGSSNSVNLTDGLDGLAAGCILFACLVLAAFAFVSNNMETAKYLNLMYLEGSGEIAIFLSSVFGATLGFLWYNGHPAQVFMGDTGSLALGGILGVSAVLLRREFLLALVGGIFVVEALSVILQVASYRLRNKKRIFLCAPLHHHFEYKGWPETKVVLRFWIVSLILALIGLASIKLQ